MKLILSAALVALAMPAFAQDTAPPPPPAPQTEPMPAPAPMAPADAAPMAAPAPMPMAAPAPAPMTGPVPWCSKTVTDGCKEKQAPNGAGMSPRPPGS